MHVVRPREHSNFQGTNEKGDITYTTPSLHMERGATTCEWGLMHLSSDLEPTSGVHDRVATVVQNMVDAVVYSRHACSLTVFLRLYRYLEQTCVT